MNIYEIIKRYQDSYFTPFPLARNSKKPRKGIFFCTIEDEIFSYEQDSNIGLLAGSPNGLRIVDSDSIEADNAVSNKLEGMGLLNRTTIVETPKRGLNHFYLRIPIIPIGLKSRYNLPKELGEGEFRLSEPSYVAAYPSKLPEGHYKIKRGGIEKFLTQPEIAWIDINWLLPDININLESETEISRLPVRLNYRPSSPIQELHSFLRNAEKGSRIPKIDCSTGEIIKNEFYKSRSEAEAAIVFSLILLGWDYYQIKSEFDCEMPGHYMECRNRDSYLKGTYYNAIQRIIDDEKRNNIANAYRYTKLIPWPGRGGDFEQRAIMAIIAKAYQFGTYKPKISFREISEHGGMSTSGAKSAVKRLKKSGELKQILSKAYDPSQFEITPFINKCQKSNNNPSCVKNMTNGSYLTPVSWQESEIWSRGKLGGSSKLVYIHLDEEKPKSVSDLKKLTGKWPNTVKNCLRNKLEPYGLVKEIHNGWIRGERNIQEVAEELKTKYRAEKKINKHREERKHFKKIFK